MLKRLANFAIIFAATLALGACGTTAAPVDIVNQTQGGNSADASESAEEFVSPDNYVLGQGDRISIQVFDEPDLTMEALVGASGIINYSYLGDVRVTGKTPFELEQQITSQLRNGYLVNPSVNVTVAQYRPFFIGGEVRSPGSYPYQPGLTLDQAIAIAGGLTDRASLRQLFIVKAGTSAGSQKKIGLSDPVGPGDTVTIKEGFF